MEDRSLEVPEAVEDVDEWFEVPEVVDEQV